MDLRLLLEMAHVFDGDRIAISDTSDIDLSVTDLHARAHRAAGLFIRSGADQVAYFGPNAAALPVALFGAALGGLPFVPLNYRLADQQLTNIVGGHDLVAVAGGADADRLRSLGVERIVEPKMLLEPDLGASESAALPDVDPDDVALLLYTSGTTAAPKAAVLRHRHLAAYVIGTVELGASEATDAVLVSVPPYHVAGVMNLLSNLYSGRRIVYLDTFDPTRWLDLVRREEVTHAMVVPTMLARIVSSIGEQDAAVPSLRSLSYGGAKMPKPVIARALLAFPEVAFTNAYGLTETSSTITVLGPDDHRTAQLSSEPHVRARLHSVGVALPGVEVEVWDDDGNPCAAGAVGHIMVRGEQVAGEYLGAAPSAGAWFATRDLGHLDEDGYLFIEGRSDDTIIRGGENVAPAEIEDVLLAHPHVADCAVVGLDDEEWGQRIGAAVVLLDGASVTAEQLQAHARSHLRGSKTPDRIDVVAELPYTDTGKLLRRAVREQMMKVE